MNKKITSRAYENLKEYLHKKCTKTWIYLILLPVLVTYDGSKNIYIHGNQIWSHTVDKFRIYRHLSIWASAVKSILELEIVSQENDNF